ncbi:M28 family peptidase [uncultured Paludibaculum sp.]|uniref:M28 family peptidase n=1 Tax=uncultured Paludibaculum sp. TaxID=1765020 RepID=UPI002AAB88AC|nr:M28 family peptidase [uncultured Paludibaculum sp.]
MRTAILVLVSSCLVSLAQEPAPQSQRLRADLEFLCSDALAGRVSLSQEAEITARYIAAGFQRSGLQPVAGGSYLQPFPLIAYRADPRLRSMTLVRDTTGRVLKPGADFSGAFSREVHIGRTPVVFAGFGITAPEYQYDDYAHIDAAGKAVLIFDHEPREDDARSPFNGTGHTVHAGRAMKIANARRHGAVAILMASEPVRSHRGLLEPTPGGPTQGQSLRASAPPQALDDDTQLPVFSVSDEVLTELLVPLGQKPADLQRAIEGDLKPRSADLRGVQVELGSGNAEMHRGTSLNVAGLLEGSDPTLKSETILITAHHDHLGLQNGHVYAGANDNASGTAAVMELARLFAAGPRPKRSVLFVVFGSEEQVMLGSYYYTAHPLRPLAGTRAVLNLDMIARDEAHIPQSQGVLEIPADTSNSLNLVGVMYSADLQAAIEQENRQVGLALDTKFDRDHTLNALFRCDHLPFLAAGIPAVWLFGGFHPGYHEPSDTVEKLNFPKMEKVIRLTYRVAATLADGATSPRFGVVPPLN